MAVGTVQLYDNGPLYLFNSTAPWEAAANFQATLVTSAYTPADTHDAWSSVSANEVAAGGGYSTHGLALEANGALAVAVAASHYRFDSGIADWGASTTITAKYFVVVEDADNNAALAATDKLIFYVDLDDGGGSVSSSNGQFSVDAHATEGWFRIPFQA